MNKTTSKLELVQLILARMVEEGVTSSGDTEEAEQVAMIVESAYYDILTLKDWAFLTKAGTLLSNPDDDETFLLPYDLVSLHWVKYKDNVLEEVKDWDTYIKLRTEEVQDPKYYIVLGEVMYFDAIPEDGLIASLAETFYTKEPNAIPDDTSILEAPRRFIQVIRDQALLLAYSSLQNKDQAMGLYAQLVRNGLTYLQKWQYHGSSEKDTGYGINYGRRGNGRSFSYNRVY